MSIQNKLQKENLCSYFLIHEKCDEYPNFKFCFKHGLLKLDASASKDLKESLSLYNTVRTHTVCPNYGGTGKMIIKTLYDLKVFIPDVYKYIVIL